MVLSVYRVFGKYCMIGGFCDFSGAMISYKSQQSEESVSVATLLVQCSTTVHMVALSGACAIHHTGRVALPKPQGGQPSLIMK